MAVLSSGRENAREGLAVPPLHSCCGPVSLEGPFMTTAWQRAGLRGWILGSRKRRSNIFGRDENVLSRLGRTVTASG